MKWFSFCAVLLTTVLVLATPASADVIVDCSQQSEGSSCTNQSGEDGTCQDIGNGLECVIDSGGEDAGGDAGEEDAGAGEEDAGVSGDTGDSPSDDTSDDSDEGCSVSSGVGSPMNSLAPIALGLGLLVVARRRE